VDFASVCKHSVASKKTENLKQKRDIGLHTKYLNKFYKVSSTQRFIYFSEYYADIKLFRTKLFTLIR
jgi:hypothetical protein